MIDIVATQMAMTKMWDKANFYQKRVENAQRRLKRFGLKRLLFWKFFNIHLKIDKYKFIRNTYMELAVILAKRMNADSSFKEYNC